MAKLQKKVTQQAMMITAICRVWRWRRFRLRDTASRNAALEAQVAQHRADRILFLSERDQHMALRQDVAALHEQHATDVAALHADLTDVNARLATHNRDIIRMLFITFFFFAVIIVFLMCVVMKLSQPEYLRRHYTNGHA
eukprot:CAMPEP_0171630596 /NCGR_PEP_ID=MMETSP0990-20121206/23038_1 /TAXON_ID=483369 /ORGANISM="non described non described, Strain CCMP2098" /LENGTH=139 /DNA_ID=CAMNT_0012199825 /DNA_START=327 /DNA_END=746 /DNA_ORIENTATION=-